MQITYSYRHAYWIGHFQVAFWSLCQNGSIYTHNSRKPKVTYALCYFIYLFLSSITNRRLGPKTHACLLIVSANAQVSYLVCKREWHGVARRKMFTCSKLGQNLSGMEVRTFLRIQRVIWDHLLAPNAEIIQGKVHFSFRAERHAVKNCRLVYIYIYIYWVDKILFCC